MSYYNGTRTDIPIKQFKTEISKDGYVYATTSRLVALTYIARVIPNMFTTQNSQEIFIEPIPNFFENTTKGVSGYVYILEEKDGFEVVSQNKNCGHQNVVRIKEDVNVKSVEYIKDVYEELQKYIKSGELKIWRFETLDGDFVNNLHKTLLNIEKGPHKNWDASLNKLDDIREYVEQKQWRPFGDFI